MHGASRKSRHSVWFWLALAAIALLVGFMLFSPTFKGWVEQVAEWAERLMRAHPVGGAAVFFALTAVSALLTFASSVILVPPATEVFGVALVFCFAAQSEISGYVLGGLGYSFWKFVAAIGIAEAVFALGVVVAGESLLEAKPGMVAAIAGILFVVAIGAGMMLKRRRSTRRK